jgi:hypothetical protein
VETVLYPLPAVTLNSQRLRILDFDIETLAAGFADPNWVPQKITCISYSWVGSDEVKSVITGKDGFFDRRIRGRRMAPFLEEFNKADVVTGHNVLRFDLPVLNAESILCGLGKLPPVAVHDTMKLPKTKGLKKGLDNLGLMLEVEGEKQAMSWGQWDNAYEVDGWPEVISRCESDVIMHKQIRQAMIDAGIIGHVTNWKP